MAYNTRSFGDRIFLVIKGLAMGAANKVPGVSGGVVAFVAGFYEEFIYSLQKFNLNALKLLINFRFKSFYKYINGRFLSLLLLGMLISYFSVSKLLDFLIVHYERRVWSTFFGLIIGSIYYIAKDYEPWTRKNLLFLSLGIVCGGLISLLEPAQQNDNLWFVFFCGMIGVCGMTLPGLSGSFLLIILGNYVLLLVDAVNALYDTLSEVILGDFSFWNQFERVRMLKVLVVFSLGSIAGLITLSHILSFVLKKFKNSTFAVIIGFITGSLGVVWPWKNVRYKTDAIGQSLQDAKGNLIIDQYDRYLPALDSETALDIAFISLGIATILALEGYGNRQRKSK